MAGLEGIYPALVTPFTETGMIDEKALCAIIDDLLGKGIQGFYVGGSTGESLLMSKDERKSVLKLVVEHVNRRVKVLAHIGCFYTQDSIELAEYAASLNVDAISSLPPFYYKFTLAELTQYYLDIVQAVPMPMIVYNAPALTGVSFDSDNIKNIFQNENVIGLKYTSYDLYQMQRMIARNPKKIIINGHDELFLSTLAIGTQCAIGSTFNFMAEKFIKIKSNFESGNLYKARKLQDEANTVIEALIQVGVFRGVKGILNLIGLSGGNCRKPFAPLTAAEMKQLEKVLPLIVG